MKTMAVFACVLLALAPAVVSAALTPVTVNAPTGPVTGYVGTVANEFRGIPYAAPPVGELRWQPTQKHAPWTKPFIAQKDGPGCPQDCQLPYLTCPLELSEDCLLLNVFTPKNANSSSNLATMLFIHGGNYKQGYAGGILYDGAWLASHHNVVVVVIQYRLGALGFLYTDNGIAGNFGIQDQQMSMKWVQENIAAFGGNPNLVTLFGQSAGAMSIAVHLLVESSKGLFQHAIMESEPFGLPYRSPSTWGSASKALAKYAGCSDTGNFDSCLRNASAEAIVAAQVEVETDLTADLSNLLQVFLPWTPTVGGDFLPEQPMIMFQQGKSHDLPFIIGTVWNEATIFVYEAFTKALPALEYDVVLGAIFGLDDSIKILEHLPCPKNESSDCRLAAAKVATQALFVCATRNVSLIVSGNQQSPIHVYHYDHLMSFRKLIWGKNFSICLTEVCHGAELVPVFHPKVSPFNVSYTANEMLLSGSMDTFWTNQAKYGTPGSFNGLAWPAFSSAEQETMLFTTPADSVHSKEFEQECSFWTDLAWWSKALG